LRILAAVDPSRAESRAVARSVLQAALQFGDALDCRVRVVHAFPEPENFTLISAIEVSRGVFYGTDNIAALHRRAVEELSSVCGIAPTDTDVRQREPAAVIRDSRLAQAVTLPAGITGASRGRRVDGTDEAAARELIGPAHCARATRPARRTPK
jgi:hypothetical protein